MMGHLESLGPALKLMRQRRGIKLFEMAELVNCSPNTLIAYERGRRLPSLRRLETILKELGATLSDLERAVKYVARIAT
ncbi:MAG TPA: helix-turn-helix transcriptional regulator [Thermoanaerobaculia bacterium]|nr:helix-turn-helix transcriptional regulator [Thermoanaerobaculia bacterium]